MEHHLKKLFTDALGSTFLSIGFCLLVLFSVIWVLGSLGGRSATDVTITFDQGHGVGVGGEVRCRGIVVGRVSDVRLDGEGVQIDVSLALPSRSLLMREGTRWWIDRPMV